MAVAATKRRFNAWGQGAATTETPSRVANGVATVGAQKRRIGPSLLSRTAKSLPIKEAFRRGALCSVRLNDRRVESPDDALAGVGGVGADSSRSHSIVKVGGQPRIGIADATDSGSNGAGHIEPGAFGD